MLGDQLGHQGGEALSERRSGLVAVLAGVAGVAADVGEEEGAQGRRRALLRCRDVRRAARESDLRGVHERGAGREAQVAVLRETARDDVVHGSGQLRTAVAEAGRGLVEVCEQRGELVVARMRRHPRQALVEHAGQAVDVHPAVHRSALDLLGRQVVDGADDGAVAREAARPSTRAWPGRSRRGRRAPSGRPGARAGCWRA